MKEYVQKFRRIVRESGSRKRSLVEEFKCGLNRTIQQKLTELEH